MTGIAMARKHEHNMKEVREACFDLAVDTLMYHADTLGYKAEEPEECVR